MMVSWINPIKKVFKNRKGYSLAELLVTIAIISILAGFGFVGVAHYTKGLKLLEMDSAAKKIFVSAQNHLTSAKSYGDWETKISELQGNDEEYEKFFGKEMSQKPDDYTDSAEWSSDTHDYRYIRYSGSEEDLTDTALSMLLPFGSIEEQVRADGTYVIEYDVKTATVYGVFYTDNSEKFSYEGDIMGSGGLDESGGRDSYSVGKNARKNYKNSSGKNVIIGYYGGAFAKELAFTELEDLELEIKNGDILEAVIKDKNTVETEVILTFKGVQSGAESQVALREGDRGFTSRFGDNKWWTVEKERGITTYHVVLDDIRVKGGHFADKFPDFYPGEDITIKAEVVAVDSIGSPKSVEGRRTNSLFAQTKPVENGGTVEKYVATISSVRHLQNLEPTVSNIDNDPYNSRYPIVKTVEQSTDLSLPNFFSDEVGTSIYLYNSDIDSQTPAKKYSFVGITNQAIDRYKGNGNGKTLDKFYITSNSNGNAGLFAEMGNDVKDTVVENLILSNFEVVGDKDDGNIGTLLGKANNLEIKNVFVINAYVHSDKNVNAGGLGGTMNNVKIEGCGIYIRDTEDKKSWELYEEASYNAENDTSGTGYVIKTEGGSVGGLAGLFSKSNLIDSFASVPVYAGNNGIAGGLVGKAEMVNGGYINIANSYTGGYTKEGKKTNFYGVASKGDKGIAGGIIGECNSEKTELNNSFSAVSVYGGGVAGGMIGSATGGAYKLDETYSISNVEGKTTGGYVAEKPDYIPMTGTDNVYLEQNKGENDILISCISIISYDEMINKFSSEKNKLREQYTYDETLKNQTFPFKMVTKTDIQMASYNWAYYGDWIGPEEKKATGNGIGLVYYEVIDGEFYYHGYVAEMSETGVGSEYIEVYGDNPNTEKGLLREKGKFVSEDGYLIIVPEDMDIDNDNIRFQYINWEGKKLLSQFGQTPKNSVVANAKIDGYKMYYILDTFTYSDYIYIGKAEGEWSGFIEHVKFAYNLQLGDAVGPGTQPLKTYQVRSARQLAKTSQHMGNIGDGKLANMSGNQLIQTLDIDLKKKDITSNGDPITYTYGPIEHMYASYISEGYSNGYCSISGLETPFISFIDKDSLVRGVTIINSSLNYGDNAGNGMLAKQNNGGTVENCSVTNSTINGGAGFINTINNGSTVKNCSVTNLDINGGVGFVNQINGGIIDSCYISNATVNNGDAGFVGTNNGVVIRNCKVMDTTVTNGKAIFVNENNALIENSFVRASTPSKDAYDDIMISGDNVGGFVYNNNGATIKNSYFVGKVTGNNVAGFAYKNVGIIDNCYTNAIVWGQTNSSGMVDDNNGGTITNCFVTGDVTGQGSNTLSSGFFRYAGGSTVKNSYTALFKLSGTNVVFFGRSKGGTYTDCNWLGNSTIVSGNTLVDENIDIGSPLSYSELTNTGAKPDTKIYLSSGYLNTEKDKDEQYPFKFNFNPTADYKMEFWGDWPALTAGWDGGFIYYEIVDNKFYYHGYVTTFSPEGKTSNHMEIYSSKPNTDKGLLTDPNKNISEWGYLFLLPTADHPNFTGVSVTANRNNYGKPTRFQQYRYKVTDTRIIGDSSLSKDYQIYYTESSLPSPSAGNNLIYAFVLERGSGSSFADYAVLGFNPKEKDTVTPVD